MHFRQIKRVHSNFEAQYITFQIWQLAAYNIPYCFSKALILLNVRSDCLEIQNKSTAQLISIPTEGWLWGVLGQDSYDFSYSTAVSKDFRNAFLSQVGPWHQKHQRQMTNKGTERPVWQNLCKMEVKYSKLMHSSFTPHCASCMPNIPAW